MAPPTTLARLAAAAAVALTCAASSPASALLPPSRLAPSLRRRAGGGRTRPPRSSPPPADAPSLPPTSAAPSPLASSASDLHTAYEYLARERYGSKSPIRWVDVASGAGRGGGGGGREPGGGGGGGGGGAEPPPPPPSTSPPPPALRVPLYPLPACYLPSGAMHRLNNVEPRNLRMAEDLRGGEWDGLFCVAMRALDTGRVARVGTLMRLIDAEEHRGYDGSLFRIRVECGAEGLVTIEDVENPEARTEGGDDDEYPIATVRPLDDSATDGRDDADPGTLGRLVDDYRAVRSMYVDGEGVAARELPPFAADAARDIPPLSLDDFADRDKFWDAAEAWQVLCSTVREARRCDLGAGLNEVMISAAAERGGPLELPVRRERLSGEVRDALRRMEREAAEDFEAMGMDPCLDFQALISCAAGHGERVERLACMVSRERRRLEAKESLKGVFLQGGGSRRVAGQAGADAEGRISGFQ